MNPHSSPSRSARAGAGGHLGDVGAVLARRCLGGDARARAGPWRYPGRAGRGNLACYVSGRLAFLFVTVVTPAALGVAQAGCAPSGLGAGRAAQLFDPTRAQSPSVSPAGSHQYDACRRHWPVTLAAEPGSGMAAQLVPSGSRASAPPAGRYRVRLEPP